MVASHHVAEANATNILQIVERMYYLLWEDNGGR